MYHAVLHVIRLSIFNSYTCNKLEVRKVTVSVLVLRSAGAKTPECNSAQKKNHQPTQI